MENYFKMKNFEESIFKQIKKLWENQQYSSKHSVYWDLYENIFSNYDLTKRINILEIGVDTGTGMELLKKVFPNSNICGIDIRNITSTIGKVWVGDQKDENFLNIVNSNNGPFDIIIDDGSHVMEDQIKTFEYLFTKMNPGGIYIVEDTHTSYWKSHGGGYGTNSFTNYSKNLTDFINYWAWKRGNPTLPNSLDNPNQDDIEKYSAYKINPEIFMNLNLISFYPNIIVFYKSNQEWEYQSDNLYLTDDCLYLHK